jgi:hypothetical protein
VFTFTLGERPEVKALAEADVASIPSPESPRALITRRRPTVCIPAELVGRIISGNISKK